MIQQHRGRWRREFTDIIGFELGRPRGGGRRPKRHGIGGCRADVMSDEIWDRGRGDIFDEREGREEENGGGD